MLEGVRCGLDMKLGWKGHTLAYFPFSPMIERPQIAPYHNKLEGYAESNIYPLINLMILNILAIEAIVATMLLRV